MPTHKKTSPIGKASPSVDLLRKFRIENPDVDLQELDFTDQGTQQELYLPEEPAEREQALETLMAYQRVFRVCGEDGIAHALLAQQFDSAHRIAAMPRYRFIETVCRQQGGDGAANQPATALQSATVVQTTTGLHSATAIPPDTAGKLYDKARSTVTRTQHVVASLHSTIASPYFSQTRFNQIPDSLKDYASGLPGYQELFGSLDFCQCKDCNSIFSPAAYFLDIMRITDEYITQPNSSAAQGGQKIPAGMTLADRRPDLFTLPLTCAKTNDLVPYLRIVNEILEKKLSEDTRKHVMETLALARYPFNLPYHLPLAQLRIYGQQLKTSLTEIFTRFNKPLASGKVQSATTDTITLAEHTPPGPRNYLYTQVEIIHGKGAGQQRTIIAYDEATRTARLANAWTEFAIPDDKSQYYIIDTLAAEKEYLQLSVEETNYLLPLKEVNGPSLSPFYGYEGLSDKELVDKLKHVDVFLYQTGLDRPQLDSLLVQDLDENELKEGLASHFFINDTGEAKDKYMKIVPDPGKPDGPEIIDNLSIPRLNRLNRFIRLKAKLPWTYADTDWAMRSLGEKEIAIPLIKRLSRLLALQTGTTQTGTSLSVTDLCSFWHPLKNTGRKKATHPQDSFDLIFNNPILLKGKNPYDPPTGEYLPFNPGREQLWHINNNQGVNALIRSRLQAALQVSDNDLSLLAGYLYYLVTPRPVHPDDPSLLLDLTNLTWLYRLSKLSVMLQLSIADLLLLLGLLYYPTENFLEPPVAALPPSLKLETVASIAEISATMKRAGFSVARLQYILVGRTQNKFDKGFNEGGIPGFIKDLSTLAETVRITPATFVFENIDPGQSGKIFEELVKGKDNKGFIDRHGLVLQSEGIDFDYFAGLFPVSEDAFVNDRISVGISREIFAALDSNEIFSRTFTLTSGEKEIKYGVLSSGFMPFTPLGFLGLLGPAPVAGPVIAETRDLLLQVKRNIEHTMDLLPLYAGQQEETALHELASFLGTTTQMLTLLLPFSAQIINLKDYREMFLSPLPEALIPVFNKDVYAHYFEKSELIDADRSKKIFKDLINNDLHYLLENAEIPGEAANAVVNNTFTDSASLDFLFPEDPEADPTRALKLEHVQTVLLTSKRAATVHRLIEMLARASMLVRTLRLTADEADTVFRHPYCVHITGLANLTVGNIASLSRYKQLAVAFKDNNNALGKYFEMRKDRKSRSKKILALASLTGWNPGQVSLLIDQFWPLNDGVDDYNTVDGLYRLKQCFDLSSTTGIDTRSLGNLYALNDLALADLSGQLVQANWLQYTAAAGNLLAAVSAQAGEEAFPALSVGSGKLLDTQKRNVLLPYTIWHLQRQHPLIRYPSDVYQYLLIDVEMSACDNVSYIAQGIGSVQLYMQRCRMMLEEGVTRLGNIPDIWWEWMMAYRVWEVNRKIFLYPENYLNPSLRRQATAPFKKFANSLLQSNIDDRTVSDAYSGYFSDFNVLSNLVHCDSYACNLVDEKTKESVSRLLVIAHTNKDPYEYYYRTFDNKQAWSSWEKIDATINSPYPSPVYAFNKLFLFWVEIDTVGGSIIKDNKSQDVSKFIATIKYSFRQPDGKWTLPQSIADNIVIDYQIAYNTVDASGGKYFTERPVFNTLRLDWQKVYPLHIPEKALKTTTDYPNTENIFVLYGFEGYFSHYLTDPIPPIPSPNQDPELVQFETKIRSYMERLKNFMPGKIPGYDGLLPFQKGISLNQNLVVSDIDALLIAAEPSKESYGGYAPALNRADKRLWIEMSRVSGGIIPDNYYYNYYVDVQPVAPTDVTTYYMLSPLLYNTSNLSAASMTVKNVVGSFIFDNGDETFLSTSQQEGLKPISEVLSTGYNNPLPTEFSLKAGQYAKDAMWPTPLRFKFDRISTCAGNVLNRKLLSGGIANLLTLDSQAIKEPDFNRLKPDLKYVIPPGKDQLDFNGAYGMYFWEVFFHSPFLVADSLNTHQRFAEALEWYQYIFNPTQPPENASDATNNRFWRFLPFRDMHISTLIEVLSNPAQIKAYNDDPFDPDAIARLRPVAYAKAIVMKYIKNLLDWGDYLYAQDTRESITQATNLYVMASDLLGKRPVAVKDCPVPKSMDFTQIKNAYNKVKILSGKVVKAAGLTITLPAEASSVEDAYTGMYITVTDPKKNEQKRYIVAYNGKDKTATVDIAWAQNPDSAYTFLIFKEGIPQFFIRLENSPLVTGGEKADFSSVPFNDIPSYFCIPENAEFIGCWDLVEDRLYKIRHCMNIQGIERPLALFAPPLDPHMLTHAAAAGSGLSFESVLEPSVPFYRFSSLVEKARSLAGTVVQLGNSLLSALDKKDTEALSLLQTTQGKRLLDLTTALKEQQLNELKQQQGALQESRKQAAERYRFYTDLIQRGLSVSEIRNIEEMNQAMLSHVMAGTTNTMASVAYAIPNTGSPFAMTYGGVQLGAVFNAVASAFEVQASAYSYLSQLSITQAGYERRKQEWQLQQKMAGFDDAQISYTQAANAIQQQIASRDLLIHLDTIRQSEETEAFLKDKFTNVELSQWMVARLSTIYFQVYTLAYNLARSAQRAYQYELNNFQTFIHFGYWDGLRKGLLAGEGLQLAIEQMAKAWLDNNVRTLEIEKTISLMQLDPKALLDLINTGECYFNLTEKLFDSDFPGHYARKIKCLSLTIPAVVGPYQGIKAMLTQVANQVILKPDLNAVNFLLGGGDATMPATDVLRSNWWINQQVALSGGVNDAGLFELNYNDERYLPFEGTGAVSSWKLSMPKTNNHFNYAALTDVIVQLKYVAFNGSTAFRDDVQKLEALQAL